MKITDSVALGDARVNDAGYLEANARTARVGVQQYLGSEVGKPELGVVNVYRDEREVFSKRSLDTFSKIPITNDHPAEAVTAANWRDLAVGTTGDEVLRDGEYLKIGLKITDAAAVKAVQDGKRELSVGYTTDLVWENGVAPDGTPYQARQTAIAANHIAIVARGRAGSKARIGDGASWGASPFTQTADERKGPMADTLRKMLVDGLQVETTDAGAAAIEKLLGDKKALETRLDDAEKAHQAALAAKDAELAKKDAAIDAEKAKVLSDADIDKRVQARADLITVAKSIAKDVKTEGLSDAAIRKAVVVAKFGDAAIAGKPDAYVDARFDLLVEDAAKGAADPFAAVVKDGVKQTDTNSTSTAHKAMTDHLTSAWMGSNQKGAA
ncbi:DUF2213 domain-containing protein [Agrobacterium leguminum]